MKNRTAFNLYVCAWFGVGYWLGDHDTPLPLLMALGALLGVLNAIMHDAARGKKGTR